MARNVRSDQLRNAILADLRSHEPLLEALDVDELGGVDGPSDQTRQVYSRQTIQDTDYPVGVSIGLMRSGGSSTSSSTSVDFIVQATVQARLGWRQGVDSDPELGLSESRMDYLLSLVGERANVAFGIPYLRFNGAVGGADMIEVEDGAEWGLPARWSVTRTVIGDDGPRN